jgi:pilus assembly protein CpaC
MASMVVGLPGLVVAQAVGPGGTYPNRPVAPNPISTIVVPATTTPVNGYQAPPGQPATLAPATGAPSVPDNPGNGPRVIQMNPSPANAVPAAPRPEFPTVVPIEGPGGAVAEAPKFIRLGRDTTGLIPEHPPGPAEPRPDGVVTKQVNSLFTNIQEAEAEISVVINNAKLFETRKPLKRIAIASPSVADVTLLNDQPDTRVLNIIGKSFGTTTITFWGEDDRPVTFLVRVTLDTLDLEKRVKQAFPGALIHIRQIGPQIILEGQVPDAKTMSEVLTLVSMELRNSGRGQAVAGATQATTSAAASGAAQGAASSGMPPSSAAAGASQGASSAQGGTTGGGAAQIPIINRVRVPGPRQILLHVKLAELNRTAMRELGVSWLDTRNNAVLGSTAGNASTMNVVGGNVTQASVPGARNFQGPVATAFNATSSSSPTSSAQLFGIFNASQFALYINALRSNSLAKILAEPNLVTLDGQPAHFLAGGRFPYPVAQGSATAGGGAAISISWENFGAEVNFIPHVLANDVIRLVVEPSFSQLNYGAGVALPGAGVVPGISTRSVSTEVELREGQTLAIAGLLQTSTNGSTVRIPGLGDLPIVGPWFSTNQVQTVETELVVLVTPELVAPMEANEIPPAPGDRVFQPNDYEFYFLGRIEGKLGREFRATVREHDPLDVMKHFQSENQWVIGPHGHSD